MLSLFVLFTSCDKSKTCHCTVTTEHTGGLDEFDDLFNNLNSTSTSTQRIEKGKCSDLNETATTSVGGMSMIATAVCTEK